MHEYSFLLLLPKKIFAVYPTKVCTQHRSLYFASIAQLAQPRSYIPGRKIFDKSHFSILITVRRGFIVRIDILSDSKFSFSKNKFLGIKREKKREREKNHVFIMF